MGVEINSLVLAVSIIPFTVGIATYLIKKSTRRDIFFTNCVKSLNSNNDIEQSTSAIMLRSYINRINYKTKTKDLIASILGKPKPFSLKKTLADGLSYVDSLKGQDLQGIKIQRASIKPKSCIKYKLTGKQRYKRQRISLEQTDFFESLIQECSLNYLDARKAVFKCSNLSGTSFHNCLLQEANFIGSNVKGVTFDKDCVLENADFKGAIGLSEAKIKNKNENEAPQKLIHFLDENGKFTTYSENIRYSNEDDECKIFVSKLGVMDSVQKSHYDIILNMILDLENTSLDYIDREQYVQESQLQDIMTHLEKCDGCVIFAFEYLEVNKGCIHKNMDGQDRKPIENKSLASPWLHVETALANSKMIPCLIIYERNLSRNGMFDEKIVNPGNKLFALKYSDSINTHNDTLQQWISLVREFHNNKGE